MTFMNHDHVRLNILVSHPDFILLTLGEKIELQLLLIQLQDYGPWAVVRKSKSTEAIKKQLCVVLFMMGLNLHVEHQLIGMLQLQQLVLYARYACTYLLGGGIQRLYAPSCTHCFKFTCKGKR